MDLNKNTKSYINTQNDSGMQMKAIKNMLMEKINLNISVAVKIASNDVIMELMNGSGDDACA